MPALPDLDAYSIPDLEELQERIAARIVVLRKPVAAELRERFAKEAEAAGLSIEDLLAPKSARRSTRPASRNVKTSSSIPSRTLMVTGKGSAAFTTERTT